MRNRHRMQRWHGSATAKEMLMSKNPTAGRTRSAIQHKENTPSKRRYRGRAGGASVLRGYECESEATNEAHASMRWRNKCDDHLAMPYDRRCDEMEHGLTNPLLRCEHDPMRSEG